MAFLGKLQSGLVLLLEKPLMALLRKPGAWFVTMLVYQRIMTCFLWHLTVKVARSPAARARRSGAVSRAAERGVVGDQAAVGAGAPRAHRGEGAGYMAVRGVAGRRTKGATAILAAVTVIAGLGVMANAGGVGKSGVTRWWPLLPVLGMWVLRGVRVAPRAT